MERENWKAIAESQAIIIEELSKAYRETLLLLSQFETVETEEKRLENILKEHHHDVT